MTISSTVVAIIAATILWWLDASWRDVGMYFIGFVVATVIEICRRIDL
jgi:hypothetical protein